MNRTPEIIDELRKEIAAAAPGELPSIRGQLAALEAELLTRLFAAAGRADDSDVTAEREQLEDRLLTVEETAQRLGQKPQWVRAHQDSLPRVQLPGRTVRFSEKGLERWLKRHSS